MIEDLFAELDKQLSTASKGLKSLSTKINNSTPSKQSRKKQLPATYKHVERQAPSFPFPKAGRFKIQAKADLNSTQLSFASVSTNISVDSFYKKTNKNVVFGKSERFKEKTDEELEGLDYKPNYQIKFKKTINSVVYQKMKEGFRKTVFDVREEEGAGPGAFEVEMEEKRKGGVFMKEKRFGSEEVDERSDINPDYNCIKPKTKCAFIKKPIQKTKAYKEKKKLDEIFRIISAKYQLNKSLDNDKVLRPNVPGAAFGENKIDSENPISKKRKMIQLFALIDKLKYFSRRGPGLYKPAEIQPSPCMAVYRSCSPEIRRICPKNKQPAPNHYNPQTTQTHPIAYSITFPRSPKHKPPKYEDFDFRPALHPNKAFVLPAAPNIIISKSSNRKKRIRCLSDIREDRLGPGQYNVLFELVERRNDLGVVGYKLTEFNDRKAQMDPVPKDLADFDLNPNFDFDKPNKLVYKYHQDLEWKPPNPSNGMLFRERWRFYDYNVNAVRPEIRPIDFARNLNMKEFLQFEYELAILENYLKLREKVPDVGKYDLKYTQIDKDVMVRDFEKYPDREQTPQKDEHNLILNPDKLQPHLPALDFEKQLGRQNEEPSSSEQLLLNPNFNQIDKNIPTLVDYSKGISKETESKPQNEQVLIDINFNQLENKIKGNCNFEKQVAREDDPVNKIIERKEEISSDPNFEVLKPKIPTLVKMDKGEKRFKEGIVEEKEGERGGKEGLDINEAFLRTKPELNVMRFDGYSEREGGKREKKDFIIKKINI